MRRFTRIHHRLSASVLGCVVLALMLTGCAEKKSSATFDNSASTWNSPPPYLLQPGDEVEVKFQYSPQMNERELIHPDGQLALPYLPHGVTAAGLTVDQLRDGLVKAYGSLLVRPSIEVFLRTATANRAYVAGEVNLESAIPLNSPTTVSNAISMAEGIKITAKSSSIVVMRQMPDGRTLARRIDYNRIANGSDSSQDIVLAAGDLVYVPQTWIGNLDNYANQFRLALPAYSDLSAGYNFGPGTRVNRP